MRMHACMHACEFILLRGQACAWLPYAQLGAAPARLREGCSLLMHELGVLRFARQRRPAGAHPPARVGSLSASATFRA